jgi:16S rRNA (cytosine1402-N4)-methyltransferase
MNTNRAEYLPHNGVMIEELTSIVETLPKGVFIDATYGYGSHFQTLKEYQNLNLIGFDRDTEAIAAKKNDDKVIKLNFSEIPNYLNKIKSSSISGIFYDFGLSSHQIDSSERGFSFQQDAELDMRMDKENYLTAKDVINDYSLEELLNVFNNYSEEKYSFQIAKKIIELRPVNTTIELVNLIRDAIPRQNPIFINKTIRRIFQGIRIEVNDELLEIKKSLDGIKSHLSTNGAIVCISYHSLEDKIVKAFMQNLTIECICNPKAPICNCNIEQEFRYFKKKKYTPSKEEITFNQRAKSAIMRCVIKL